LGQTIGGIQLAEYAYPNAIIKGAGTTGPGFCWLTGMHQFFTSQELAARYPDPHAYLAESIRLTEQNVARGFILPFDAAQTIREAYRVFQELLRSKGHTPMPADRHRPRVAQHECA